MPSALASRVSSSARSASRRAICRRFWNWPKLDSMTRRTAAGSRYRSTSERGRAVAHAELALDRLGRAAEQLPRVVLRLGAVEGDQALALGVDPAPAGAPGHLRQLVQAEPTEAGLAALPDPLDHHAPGRHVDAQAHGLGGEDHLDQPALEEDLGQALQGRQDPGVVHPRAVAQPREEERVHLGLGHDARVIPQRVGDRLVHLGAPLRRQERVAVLQVASQRALASRPAEDEVDGREPLPLAKLRDDPVRAGGPAALPVPAEGVPVAARPAGAHPQPGRADAAARCGASSVAISPSGWQRRYWSGTGRTVWTMGWMGRWTSPIQAAISCRLLTVAESPTSWVVGGALMTISSQTVPRPSSPR